jgi:FKBP-type peptidyl-prolyl cis-trans isomerase 2
MLRETAVRLSLRALRASLATFLFFSALGPGSANANEEGNASVVSEGNRVSIEYTLKLDDGSVADSNVGGEALTYEQGKGQLLPALEQELLGLKIGDSKQVSLSAAQGYGEIDEAAYQKVPTSSLPEDARIVGTQLVAQAPTGEQQIVRIHEITGEEVVMDFNHPLAGQALHFDVKILEIQ